MEPRYFIVLLKIIGNYGFGFMANNRTETEVKDYLNDIKNPSLLNSNCVILNVEDSYIYYAGWQTRLREFKDYYSEDWLKNAPLGKTCAGINSLEEVLDLTNYNF